MPRESIVISRKAVVVCLESILYCEKKKWLYLCEAVTSHGPVSSKRFAEIEKLFSKCNTGRVYVSAFEDKSTFRKYAADIAWESEVWLSEDPDHMIHFDGEKSMRVRVRWSN